MELREIVEMCYIIFNSAINSEISNVMIEKMVKFAKNGEIPFKAKSIIDELVYDNSNYDLGVLHLGEYTIYDSLKTGRDGDGISMTRFIRLTKGVGENERELDIEL